MKILAGDIGGTKTLLQIAEVRGTHVKTLHQARFASQDFADFELVISDNVSDDGSRELFA